MTFSGRSESHERTRGDDVVIQLRVRRANLPALEKGIELGFDWLTHRPIVLRLWSRSDGVHELEVITNAVAKAAAPDAVDAEIVP